MLRSITGLILLSTFFPAPRSEESKEIDPEGSWKLIDEVMETSCLCKKSDDDNVQLQLLKVLLTIATSPFCEVDILLLSFHVH
jgi:hypothetical protein